MLHTNNGAIHEKRNLKTFGFAREKFSAKVRLDTKMPSVPIILSKSVYIYIYIYIYILYIHIPVFKIYGRRSHHFGNL